MHLLVQLFGHRGRIFGEQWLSDVEALFAKHDGGEGAHAVFYFFVEEHSNAFRGVVDSEPHSWNAPKGPFMMFCFETKISFDKHDDFGELEHCDLADAVDVAQDELKLLAWLCRRCHLSE